MTGAPVPISGVVQHYAWGDRDAIPRLLGVEPDGRPWAELWLGDHPAAPATVPSRNGAVLDEHLRFLLKVLAAAEPLSLQAHPTKAQAEAGFAREEAAGIARDAPPRIYRDTNHKPELLCALDPFVALCGFREPADAAATLRSLEIPLLAPVVDALHDGDLATALDWLLTRDPQEGKVVADAVAVAAADDVTRAIAAAHPGDIGVVTAMLLHQVVLAPGQAIALEAGTLHAYVRGVGIEIMAASDNVVRGGLTEKHVDVDELRRILRFVPERPHVIDAVAIGDGVSTWPAPTDAFRLLRVDASGKRMSVGFDGPAIALCTDGSVSIDDVSLPTGGAAYLPATTAPRDVRGPGTVFVAV